MNMVIRNIVESDYRRRWIAKLLLVSVSMLLALSFAIFGLIACYVSPNSTNQDEINPAVSEQTERIYLEAILEPCSVILDRNIAPCGRLETEMPRLGSSALASYAPQALDVGALMAWFQYLPTATPTP